MFCKRSPAAVGVAFVILATCSRPSESPIRRIAVLRFENLTPDRSLDWMGRAASEAIARAISGAPDACVIPSNAIHGFDSFLGRQAISAPGVSSENTQARLAGATHLIYGDISFEGGKLHLSAREEDVATRKMTHYAQETGSSPSDLLSSTDRLARQFSRRVLSPLARNDEALRHYATALEVQPSDAALEYERAVSADPDFGVAYVNWIHIEIARQDRVAAETVLNRAKSRGNGIAELDRSRLALEALNLRPDPAASVSALSTAVRLTPNDLGILGDLATAELATGHPAEAAGHYRAALRTAPGIVELWNSLGYAEMYAGNYSAAIQALTEYRRRRPNEANPLDSDGDVNFYFGNFAEAEKLYLQAYAKSGDTSDGDLIKAAYARLLSGDLAGANQVFDRYRAAKKPGEPLAAFRMAQWQFLTGHRNEAVGMLTAVADAAALPGVRSGAETQVAIWELQLGNRAGARQHAARAAAAQASPVSGLVQFISDEPGSAANVRARAEQVFPGAQSLTLRRFAVGYSLLFAGNFADAAPVWREIADNSLTDRALAAIYGWTLVETGRAREAGPMLRYNPIPQPNSAADFSSLVYPGILYARAAQFDQEGKKADALRNYKLFLTLVGTAEDVFGDKRHAARVAL